MINGEDLILAKRHIIGEDEVKQMTVNMLVYSGAYRLAINETIKEQFQFPVIEKRKVQMANGSLAQYDVVCPVEVRFKNRQCTCRAMVLPGDNELLLGAIPMEDMDFLIHPLRQELIINLSIPILRR